MISCADLVCYSCCLIVPMVFLFCVFGFYDVDWFEPVLTGWFWFDVAFVCFILLLVFYLRFHLLVCVVIIMFDC